MTAQTDPLWARAQALKLHRSPHEQIKEQLRLTIETIKERQEYELIDNPDYGLLASVGLPMIWTTSWKTRRHSVLHWGPGPG